MSRKDREARGGLSATGTAYDAANATGSRGRPSAAGIPRLALTPAEAAAAIGISEDHFNRHVRGELRLVRRGRKVIVAIDELERWLDTSAARTLEERR